MTFEDIEFLMKTLRDDFIPKKKGKDVFILSDYHVMISLDSSKGYDAIAYMEYNPRDKIFSGVNPMLKQKLKTFFKLTQNYQLMSLVEKSQLP